MSNYYASLRPILAVSALLVSLASTSLAQPAAPEREPKALAQTEEQELKIPELAAREMSPDVLSIAIPKPCGATHPDIQIHGNPAGNLTLSPALKSFLSSHNLIPKGYDNPTINKVFADSFRLRSCRVCYATLEVRFKHGPGPWSQGPIWSAAAPASKTVTYSLQPVAALNNYIFNVSPPPPYVDIVVQDDTEVDYCKLSVWYY
jgi:hypothetical protein